MLEYFPQEILLEIFLKLPINSIVQCTSICKSWNAIIRNPTFISTHLNQAISSTKDSLFLLKTGQFFSFIGSCNGLICLADYHYAASNTFILRNPPICKFMTLPKPNVTFETHDKCIPETPRTECDIRNPWQLPSFVGFGFDSHTNDYKVLRIAEFNNNEMPMIEVYSLIAGSWKFLPTTRQKYNIVQKCKQAFVNGVVHFIAFQEDEHGDTEKMYVPGFDFSDEFFCEFMLLEESYSPIQCSLWAMKKYGDLESWTKLFAKQGEAVPRALGLRKSGELLLDFYRSSTKGIVSYDAEKQQRKSINIHNKRGDHFLCTYVESLALLDKP
ncbi:hypothetical protein P3X46_024410 [Hevea brasiliensis]|uniref:F-box domain-containing protein n=1 Tax=Hevea brasiliensis TaxID=3981 RepID=A0ABQ9L5Z6_HEVBR|nr:hypothetical protein P3X46_024410 [Hevea brasiliensis]